MRTAAFKVLVPGVLALALAACADAGPDASGTTTGGASGSGGANSAGGTNASGAGAPTQPASGAGTANAPAGTAGAYVKPSGTGGNDDGGLFDPSSAVPFDPNAGKGGAPPAAAGSGGGPNTDGFSVTSHISGNANGTAEFTQHGKDVTVVVKLTKCPDGTLGIHINDGDSCDNTGTEGKPWDGNRGNIGDAGTIMCSKNSASMTYTRSGADPALNWTVGDHTKADLTPYVVIVSSAADGKSMSSFIGCGNFFK